MATFSSDGIIIKRKNFGEADRILTIVTPYKGKISVIAKGVRRITSRRGGNVEMLNSVKMHIFQGQGMPLLSEAESLETFPKIKNDLLLSTYGLYLAELADRLLPEEQPNPQAYNLLLVALSLLETNPRQIFIRAFEVKLLAVLGYWSSNQVITSTRLKNLLDDLQKFSWEEIENMEVEREDIQEAERILRQYLEKVLEGPIRSVKMIQKLR